jgi:hypothetical protein
MFLSYYLMFFFLPLVFLINRLWSIEKQNRRAADALEKIAKSLEAKPLKLDDVVELDQRL